MANPFDVFDSWGNKIGEITPPGEGCLGELAVFLFQLVLWVGLFLVCAIIFVIISPVLLSIKGAKLYRENKKELAITCWVISFIVGIGIIIVGIGVSRQYSFGEKSLQMRTPVSTSYPVASIPDLSGKWKGSYIEWDARGIGCNIWFEMELKQNGTEITGITTEERNNRILTARINGRVEGRAIRFVKQYNWGLPAGSVQSIEYKGNIADDDNSMRGIWKASVVTMRWSASRVSKNEPNKGSSLLQPEANPAPKTTSDSGKTFLNSLKSMISVEATYSPDGKSPPVRKRYFLK